MGAWDDFTQGAAGIVDLGAGALGIESHFAADQFVAQEARTNGIPMDDPRVKSALEQREAQSVGVVEQAARDTADKVLAAPLALFGALTSKWVWLGAAALLAVGAVVVYAPRPAKAA